MSIDDLLIEQTTALFEDESVSLTVLSNAAALLNTAIENINWVGFYLYNAKTNQLDLGPFQGNIACMHIAPGKGVCGTSFTKQLPLNVPDIHKFAGHIACDSASQSELVIPLIKNNTVYGVLDVDAPILNRFDEDDQTTLTAFADELVKYLDFKAISNV